MTWITRILHIILRIMADYIASDMEDSDGSDYLPEEHSCSESEDDSDCFSDDSDDEDTLLQLEPISLPVLDDDWHFMSDPLADARPDPLPNFSGATMGQVRENIPDFTCPREAFCYFFDNDLINKLCEWMNMRAAEYFTANPLKRKVNGLIWKPATIDEMYVFFSLLMLMGINHLPRMHMYWSKDCLTRGGDVFCEGVMSRARFLCMLKFLRFGPIDQVDKKRPRTRIEPFLDFLRKRSQELLILGLHIAIDESLMLWKGRLGFKQFIRTKRSRFGIKVFVMCPSAPKWSGYSWNFEVYYGKDSIFNSTDPDASLLTVSELVVAYLMKDVLKKGHHVVTDNWYTSLRLGNYLLTKDTTLTGVVRADRGPPQKLKEEQLNRHQSSFARKGNVLAVKYQDKKEVNVLTTRYTAGLVEKSKRYFDTTTTFYFKPLHIDEYNNLMGSVDKADQLLEPYAFERKTLAWFKKLGIHFIFRMLLNSHLAYKNCQQEYKKDFMNFILDVSRELLSHHNATAKDIIEKCKAQKRQRPKKNIPKTELAHQWETIPNRAQKRCRVCSVEHKKRKDTRKWCTGCEKKPGLCSMEHFIKWHRPNSHQAGSSGTSRRARQ